MKKQNIDFKNIFDLLDKTPLMVTNFFMNQSDYNDIVNWSQGASYYYICF